MTLYEISFSGVAEPVLVQANNKTAAVALALTHRGLTLGDYSKIVSTKVIASELTWI